MTDGRGRIAANTRRTSGRDALPDLTPAIEGLRYVPDYVDQDTHDALMASVDLHPWLWSVDHAVQIYGYRYHHPSQSVLRIGELPAWSLDLVRRLCRDGFFRSMPDQMVVNDYQPGAGFFAHIDQAVFGDQVASLSLGSTCVMEFSKGAAEGTGQILLEPRSLLLLSGEARREWLHGIPARNSDIWQQREWPRTRRVSLTFRSIPTIAEQTQQQ